MWLCLAAEQMGSIRNRIFLTHYLIRLDNGEKKNSPITLIGYGAGRTSYDRPAEHPRGSYQ
jgi:hypothetical protein